MKIYHVEFAKAGTGMSGGETCMVQVIQFFQRKGIANILLTTENGKNVYSKIGLTENTLLRYITIPSGKSEKQHIFLSYCIRIFYFFNIRRIIQRSIEPGDILICHSEFFPNTIPSWNLSRYFQKQYYWFHMRAPSLWRGFEGEYTGRFHWPSVSLIHYRLNQWLFFKIAKKHTVISNNPYYDPYLQKKHGAAFYCIQKYSGIKKPNIDPKEIKNCDIAFMGRFHRQKGLLELPAILTLLKQHKPDIRLLVIGDGDRDLKTQFLKEIEQRGLTQNVEYVGEVISTERFTVLRRAKIFCLTSYYESFGQVALEAMSNELPIVAYDLPVYCVFTQGMKKVPVRDNTAFAQEVSTLLQDEHAYTRLRIEAAQFASTFSWDVTGEELLNIIQR